MVDFGTDTSCVTGLRTGRFASGPRLVGEACFRRLTTPRGTLRGGEAEAEYGIDLADMVGHAATPSAVAALPGQIESELMKDERLRSVEANVVSVKTGPSVSWTITVEGDTAEGPFSLVVGVNDVTVELIGLQPES